MKTLVVGYGNPLREDDGVGIYVAEALEKLRLPGVEVRTCQQLPLELAEELGQYDRVVLTDAAADGQEVVLKEITDGAEAGSLSSHHLDAGLLAQTAHRLYGSKARIYLCTIPGKLFGFGFDLSPGVKESVAHALTRIDRLLLKESF